MRRPLLLAALALAAGTAVAQDRRTELLAFYPCGALLDDAALAFLADFANATKQDPCLMDAEAFASAFGGPAAAPEGAPGPVAPIRTWFLGETAYQLWLYQTLIMEPEAADGRWGPKTEAAFARRLETYLAVGGDPVEGPQDVPALLDWIVAAAYAEAVGGEFPD